MPCKLLVSLVCVIPFRLPMCMIPSRLCDSFQLAGCCVIPPIVCSDACTCVRSLCSQVYLALPHARAWHTTLPLARAWLLLMVKKLEVCRLTSSKNGQPKRKTKPKAKPVFQPVKCENAFCFSGGWLRHPVCLTTHNFEKGMFVKVSRRESWLCVAITGKGRCKAPLARVSILEKLRLAAVSHEPIAQAGHEPVAQAGREPIADDLGLDTPFGAMHSLGIEDVGLDGACPDDLGLDAPCPGQHEPLVVAQHKRGRARKVRTRGEKNQPVKAKRIVTTELVVGVEVRVLSTSSSQPGGFVLIDVADLPNLVAAMRDDFKAGGESFQPPEHKSSQPYFAARDCAWAARARPPDGKLLRKSFGIPKFVMKGGCKAHLNHDEFLEQKAKKLEEAIEWVAAVERGEHVSH